MGSKDVDLGFWSSFCVYLRLQSALEEQVDSSHRMRQIEIFEGVHFHNWANSLIRSVSCRCVYRRALLSLSAFESLPAVLCVAVMSVYFGTRGSFASSAFCVRRGTPRRGRHFELILRAWPDLVAEQPEPNSARTNSQSSLTVCGGTSTRVTSVC